MPKKITDIEIRNPDRSSLSFSAPWSGKLIDQIESDPQIVHKLGEIAQLTIVWQTGCEASRYIHSSGLLFFNRRRVLRLKYDDSSFSEWRILSFDRSPDGSEPPVLKAESLAESILSETVVARKTEMSYRQLGIIYHRLEIDDVLPLIFGTNYSAGSLFTDGTIGADVQGKLVSTDVNGQTYAELLTAICRQTQSEWEAVYNSGTDKYGINVALNIGQTVDVGKRLISSLQNRRNIQSLSESRDFYSSIIGISNTGNFAGNIGDARFEVDTVTYINSSDTTRVLFTEFKFNDESEENVFAEDMVPYGIEDRSGNARAITDVTIINIAELDDTLLAGTAYTSIPIRNAITITLNDGDQLTLPSITGIPLILTIDGNQSIDGATTSLTVVSVTPSWTYGSGAKIDDIYKYYILAGNMTGVIGAGDRLRFCRDADATPLYRITSQSAVDAFGDIDHVYNSNDIPPWSNILRRYSITDDLSQWSAGMPVGWNTWEQNIGPITVSEITDTDYVQYGTKAAKVEFTDAGDRFETDDFTLLNPDTPSPYFSLWAAIRVTSGSVRLQLRDSDNVVHPPVGEPAESNVDNIVAIAVGGTLPALGSGMRIEFVAQEADTTFYVDAVTFTNSTQSISLKPAMGPEELFLASARELKEKASLPKIFYEVSFYDLGFIDSVNYDEIRIGDFVTFKDDYDIDDETFSINDTPRVLELVETESQTEGRLFKTVRLSIRRANIATDLDRRYVKVSDPRVVMPIAVFNSDII